jgi:mono/diheme cytochrome c family protein
LRTDPRHVVRVILAAGAFGALLSACDQPMNTQPKVLPLRESTFFGDGRASRDLVANTIARGKLRDNDALFTGKVNDEEVTTFPLPVSRELIARGQERFNIFCAPCHARTGDGNGMIVQRGYAQPPSLHEDRLATATLGHFYDVITNGFGRMPDYSTQVPVHDRWAIIAYVRALQLSRRATLEDVPEAERAGLAAAGGLAQ